MSLRNLVASTTFAAAVVATAVGVSAGTAYAAPEAAVGYTATATENSTAITTDSGSLAVENNVFEVKSADGQMLAGAELSFRVDDFVFPIAAEIKDRTATLTPQFDTAHAVYQPIALPFEDQAGWRSPYEREVAAWQRMSTTIAMGASIGTLVGGIGGAAAGCVGGAIAGAALTGPLLGMFGAGPLGGCIAGAAAVGFLGTLAGQVFITAPVAILAAAQYFTTINAPMPVAPAK
ncbi:hypothetical protein AB0N05_02705 [Nocardia sp. NPDC051030]|uniref:hypothetical protein n=1 Tax=Nocardia sp. NPDC051030 TaxID=3155162 RepID=UPI00342DE02C